MINHISGVILKSHPSKLAEVKAAIGTHKNAEVVQEDDHQVIVIIEGNHANDIVDTIEQIQQQSEVLDCTPIYHHFEDEADLNLPLETHSNTTAENIKCH